MSRIKPLGLLQFNKSTAADVIAYNLYGAAVAAGVDPATVQLDYKTNLLAQVPAPGPDQTTVSIDLAAVNGLNAADGENYVFAVASQDAAGNISDMSAPIVHPLDETPPDAPTGLAWVDSGVA